ncbi:DNA internalization-related competence protein ComEC/Rec2 [Cupriavidus sp. USMAA2-4]|uniref:DNA internalization-related competence protein ComEC/Rec2 n=1 Tax=Cupriavidus sp. USMAA2-4 TaxID=876364 RepID=UPI0008A6B56E|nr:DNA internalization-related competence protein ComEC/Rec2 [Cupriavidus sp. USMAA2-4]AOY91091.1 DNA internalization-related competence protein ComEC/Rec2 [Cupriavidus sp. USMAA2-4]
MRLFLLAFVTGCWCLQQQPVLPGRAAAAVLLLAAALLAAAALYWRRRARPAARAAVCLLGLLAGFGWAGGRAVQALDAWLPPALDGSDVRVRGVVAGLPAEAERGLRFRFAIEQEVAGAGGGAAAGAEAGGARLPPEILLAWNEAPPGLRPGERREFVVRLRRPRGLANPHGFDYAYWLLGQGVGATGYVRSAGEGHAMAAGERLAWRIASWRHALRAHLRANLPPDARYGPVLVALVVGDQRGISAADREIFNRTGIGHLISISGLHITMISGMAGALAAWAWRHAFGLGRRWRRPPPLWLPARQVGLLVALPAGIGYGLVAGLEVPALRTVAMLVVAVLASWSGRTVPGSLVLGWAALAALVVDPWGVMAPGFWLSFSAVAVIFLAAGRPPAAPAADGADGARADRWPARLRVALAQAAHTQWVVTLGLVPATLLLFQQTSLVSPLANAVAIPLVSFVVTPLSLLAAILPSPLAAPLLALAHACLALLGSLLAWLSAPSWAVWRAAAAGPVAFALALPGVACLLAPRGFGWRLRWRGLVLLLPLLVAGRTPVAAGAFRATAFDVGQGGAVLVETRRHALLFDTGPAYGESSSAGERVIVPHLRAAGLGRLDMLMISHEHADHAGGVGAVLDAVPVAALRTAAPPAHALLSPPLRPPRAWEPCAAGQQWEWDGVRFAVLHPPAAQSQSPAYGSNARSCVLHVSAQAGDGAAPSLLLTGDIERAEEAALLSSLPAQALRASVLMVPHHGSGTSSSPAFLAAVAPQAAVFQLGHANRFRHPRADVWARYGAQGVARYRSDENGAVVIEAGADGVAITPYRQQVRRYWREAPPAPR